jgi:hypothetical protein
MQLRQRSTHLLALAAVGAGLTGCPKAEPPRELRLELPDVITSKEPVMLHAKAIQLDGMPRELTGEQPYRVTPADLASFGKGGMLSCSRSGEGTVSLTLAGVTGHAKLGCKLAAKLEAPERLSIDASAGEMAVPAKVLDAAGHELELPISVTSDLSSVVLARSGRLVPGNVGNAKLRLHAGQLSREIQVEVVRTLQPELLATDQNRRLHYSLEVGKYRLSIKLPAPHRLSVDWLGAPYCAYRGDGAEHRAECTLQGKGGVVFDNPAFLLRGEKTASNEGVTLQEVP